MSSRLTDDLAIYNQIILILPSIYHLGRLCVYITTHLSVPECIMYDRNRYLPERQAYVFCVHWGVRLSGTSVINDFVLCFCIISTREMSCFLSSNFSDEPLLFFLCSVPSDWFSFCCCCFRVCSFNGETTAYVYL